MSPILVTLTSRSDSNFERSNISLKENKQYGVNSNSNGFDYCVRQNERKILWFSADFMSGSPAAKSEISGLRSTHLPENFYLRRKSDQKISTCAERVTRKFLLAQSVTMLWSSKSWGMDFVKVVQFSRIAVLQTGG